MGSGSVPRLIDWRARLLSSSCPTAPGPSQQWLDESFFAQAWWRQPWLLEGPELVLATEPLAMVEQLARSLPPEQVMRRDASGQRHAGNIQVPDPAELLVLQDPHTLQPQIAALRESFARYFQCPVTTGLYLNWPGADGFVEHHDAHHVFALQILGRKTWTLGPASVRYPTRRFVHSVPDATQTQEVSVYAGQMLYLPPGVRHRARVTGLVSLHLTLGVHSPRVHDALESLLEGAAALDSRFREPIAGRRTPDGMRWELDRERLAARLRHLADRIGSWNPQLPEGTQLVFPPEPPVHGQWPTLDGRFVPPERPVAPDAQRGADRLLELAGVRSVHLRGSALVKDPHALDLDLIVVCESPISAETLTGALREVDHTVSWDARPVLWRDLQRGEASSWVTLCLAAGSVRLAGEPVWKDAPQFRPGPELAMALMGEAAAEWSAVLARPASPETTCWLEKRALRALGILGMDWRGVFTRHPDGCVELTRRLRPDLLHLAQAVRVSLYSAQSTARREAIELGQAVFDPKESA